VFSNRLLVIGGKIEGERGAANPTGRNHAEKFAGTEYSGPRIECVGALFLPGERKSKGPGKGKATCKSEQKNSGENLRALDTEDPRRMSGGKIEATN